LQLIGRLLYCYKKANKNKRWDMKSISLLTLLLLTFLLGCSKNKDTIITGPENPSLNYVQGEVVVGLKDSVSLEEIADYVYSLNNISINEISSLRYYSILPKDSIQSIKSNLESKNYIWHGTVNVSYLESESKILVEFSIKDFSSNDINDWKLLKTHFRLFHSPYHFQSGVLKVENGKENEWINILSNSNLFRFVELNYIVHTS
jgi:hypothetical protein